MPESYRIQLESFEGPLDLLLYLIRRSEVDIHDIPIAGIADQFVDTLERAELATLDIDLAGEFLVMAATLMEIKSRVLAREAAATTESAGDPGSGGEDPRDTGGEDPRMELVRQLLEYKRYRDAADTLEERRQVWGKMAPASPTGIDHAEVSASLERMREEIELEDVDLGLLVSAYQRIASSVNFDRLGEHEVLADDTPIEVYADDLVERLRRDGGPRNELTLTAALVGRPRREMLGLFLAMLDMIKDQRIIVRVEGDEIVICERKAELQDADGGARSGIDLDGLSEE